MSRVNALRSHFDAAAIDAYIVPSEDAHSSEYVREVDTRRAFISGFDGSAGIGAPRVCARLALATPCSPSPATRTAMITRSDAFLWTDGRYFNQASKQLSEEWTLMKQGLPGVPTLAEHLAAAPKPLRVGVCALFCSIAQRMCVAPSVTRTLGRATPTLPAAPSPAPGSAP